MRKQLVMLVMTIVTTGFDAAAACITELSECKVDSTVTKVEHVVPEHLADPDAPFSEIIPEKRTFIGYRAKASFTSRFEKWNANIYYSMTQSWSQISQTCF